MAVEIKCSKTQFNRLLYALNHSVIQPDGKCVLGKNQNSCPALNKKEPDLFCEKCIRRNIKFVPKEQKKQKEEQAE